VLKRRKKKEADLPPIRQKQQSPKEKNCLLNKRRKPKQPEQEAPLESAPLILEMDDVESVKVNAPIICVSKGEELVRIQKASNDSDNSDVDVDNDDDDVKPLIIQHSVNNISAEVTELCEEKPIVCVHENDCSEVAEENSKVFEFPVPTSEIILTGEIGEQEKEVHFEFFSGRPTKTPSRYLKVIYMSDFFSIHIEMETNVKKEKNVQNTGQELTQKSSIQNKKAAFTKPKLLYQSFHLSVN
jgi:hypothetical protein